MMHVDSSPATYARGNATGADAMSPSHRRNNDRTVDGTLEGGINTTTHQEQTSLFSPRSTAAMALSSISQIFSTTTASHPPPPSVATLSQESIGARSDLSKMTQEHPQLPPPQSLFSTNAATKRSSPIYRDGTVPFVPHLQHPTDHHYRLMNGPSPHWTKASDGTSVPHSTRNCLDHAPVAYNHQQNQSYPTPSPSHHPNNMMFRGHHQSHLNVPMQRQQSFPPTHEEPLPYTSPQQTMVANNGVGLDASTTYHTVKQQQPYELDSQMPPGNHHQNHHGVGQPYPLPPPQQQHQHPMHATNGPNNWTAPYYPPMPGPPTGNNNGTPSNDNTGKAYRGPPNATNSHYPINRCNSYGSANSSSHYDAGPMPQGVSSGPYHPRSVSWSNVEPIQYIPYGGPQHGMPMMPRHQQFYPAFPHMSYPQQYVTPTPHKKQKIEGDNNTTHHVLSGSKHNVFRPPKSSLTKKKPTSAEKVTAIVPTMTPILDPLCRPPTPTSDTKALTKSGDNTPEKYSRKNKSLGLLAEAFLNHFTDESKRDASGNDLCQEVMIDKLSISFNVERRRIYDVVNILEALQVIIKMGKNTYHWMGREHLTRQFALLQNEAIKIWPEHAAKSGFFPINANAASEKGCKSEQHHPADKDTAEHAYIANSIENADGYKSLTRLSQLFLQVFLMGDDPLSLPQASDLIHGGRSTDAELIALGMKPGEEYPTDEKRLQQIVARGLKTKIRRLYDIANVFLSVGLLRKSLSRAGPTNDGKRPLYYLNYHIPLHEIRSIYKTLPAHVMESKSPFSDEQMSKLKDTSNVQIKVKYFGLSEPSKRVAQRVSLPEPTNSRPPTNKNVLTASLVLPGFENCCTATETGAQPLSQSLESPCDVKDAEIQPQLSLTMSSSSMTPSSSSFQMDESASFNSEKNTPDANLGSDDMGKDHGDDQHEYLPAGATSTASPTSSITTTDILTATSIVSPQRRVSLEN